MFVTGTDFNFVIGNDDNDIFNNSVLRISLRCSSDDIRQKKGKFTNAAHKKTLNEKEFIARIAEPTNRFIMMQVRLSKVRLITNMIEIPTDYRVEG